MRTTAARRLREGSATLAILVVLLGGLTGCSLGGSGPPVPSPFAGATDLVSEITAVLDARARAVDEGDLTGFLAGLDQVDVRLVAEQRQYFANLQDLPLAAFGYELPDDATPTTTDGITSLVVDVLVQLRGYDAMPVATPSRHSFVRDATGALVLSATRDEEWERANNVDPAPWDLFRLVVQERDGVLGLFDEGSLPESSDIMEAVFRGVGEVQQELPFAWDGQVVVYAFSTLDVLAELDDLPGGDPDALDGVAFPVRAAPGSPELAGTRFMLHPRMLERAGPLRDRLIRHELTHVAMGPRDDHVPLWLSEGLAEYISVQPIPAYDRMISRDALEAARAGIRSLPADETFSGELSSRNYGLAWYACEYIVDTYGVDALWRVFDEMSAVGGLDVAGQDAVLRRVLGIDARRLAEETSRKIVETFG